MADEDIEVPHRESPRTLSDDEIVTEQKVPRRSFLSTTGALLTGATGLVLGARASGLLNSPQDDPNKRPADPDKKPADPDKKVDDPHKKEEERRKKEDDPHKRADDPNKRPPDPDRKPADPDKRPDDPHRL